MKPIISVVMFCSQFRPAFGGAERQAEKLAVALVEQGCQVMILTPRIDAESPDREEGHGVTIERFPMIDLSRRFPVPGIALLNIPYILWQVTRAVKARLKDANILHCHIASLQTAGAALAGRISGVPVLLKAAVADHRSDLGEIEKNGFSGRLVAYLVRLLIPNWIATTLAVEEALLRAGIAAEKIARIPNGVEVSDAADSRKLRKNIKRFLYLGRLSTNTQRDVPTLIKAFDYVATILPDVELAIVGGGDLLEVTRKLVGNCLASNRIYAPGFDDSEKWLTWADCFVLPSRREGLSNALLEAMAAGLPCIANDIPPNREVLANGEAGLLVGIEDINDLTKAMYKMVEEKGVAEHYARKSTERVEQCYSITAVAMQYIQFYDLLIKKNFLKT